jgi:hypothetical protein
VVSETDITPSLITVDSSLDPDDSSSMRRDGRWESQKRLIQRITKITTQILPVNEGVALRFINREVDDSSNLSLGRIGQIMDPMPWQPGGDTEIGTYLKSRILEPLVYGKIAAKTLERPILVSIMTDGMPEPESKTLLAETIVECGQRLEAAKYPRDSEHLPFVVDFQRIILTFPTLLGVKFMIGQIGKATQAEMFLESLRGNKEIEPVVFITSGKILFLELIRSQCPANQRQTSSMRNSQISMETTTIWTDG